MARSVKQRASDESVTFRTARGAIRGARRNLDLPKRDKLLVNAAVDALSTIGKWPLRQADIAELVDAWKGSPPADLIHATRRTKDLKIISPEQTSGPSRDEVAIDRAYLFLTREGAGLRPTEVDASVRLRPDMMKLDLQIFGAPLFRGVASVPDGDRLLREMSAALHTLLQDPIPEPLDACIPLIRNPESRALFIIAAGKNLPQFLPNFDDLAEGINKLQDPKTVVPLVRFLTKGKVKPSEYSFVAKSLFSPLEATRADALITLAFYEGHATPAGFQIREGSSRRMSTPKLIKSAELAVLRDAEPSHGLATGVA